MKPQYVSAAVFVASVVGAYMLRNNVWDVALALVGGFVGYWLVRLEYGLLPFALGFVLAPLFETNFFQTLQVGYGTLSVFVGSGPAIVLALLCLVSALAGPRLRRRLNVETG